MGILKEGTWIEETPGFRSTFAYMQHHGIKSTPVNNWVTKDGSAGPTGSDGFKAESGRYHLYYSPGCPFAHRTSIMLKLKGLEEHITTSICNPMMYGKDGWHFDKEDGSTGDHLYGFSHLWKVYNLSDEKYVGEVSVPLLWDKKTKKAVSKESSDIIKMFNYEFNEVTGNDEDFLGCRADASDPEKLPLVEKLTPWVTNEFAFGVYKAGLLAKNQEEYETACKNFFASLEELDVILGKQKFLSNRDAPLQMDIFAFVPLIRFEVAFYYLYHLNLKRITEFKNVYRWLTDMCKFKDLIDTVKFEDYKKLYFRNALLNPSLRVPMGPEIELLKDL